MTTLETLTQGLHERPLPASWQVVPLGELIAEAQAGFASGSRDLDGVIQLRMNNVGTCGNFVWDDVLRVPADAAPVEQFRLLPGDVMFNNTNSTELVGKSALFEGYDEPVVFSNHFTRIRPKPGVLLPEFLAAWLNHQWLKGVFASICNQWIGQSAVKGDRLLKLDFPLPPMQDQKRIAATLREQMAAVEKARAAAKARLEAVKALPAAFLRQAFPQPAQRLPDGWRWVRLGEVAHLLNGRAYSASELLTKGTYPVLRVGNLFTSDHWYYSDLELDSEKYCDAGDLLYAWSASFGPFVWAGPKVIYHYHIWKVVCGNDLEPEYARYALETLTEAIKRASHGLAMLHMTKEGMGQFELPIPPLAEQKRIAAILREQMVAVDKARAAAQAELESINALPAANLRRAFAGDL